MNVIKKNIPNFITLLNLLCGIISIIFALNNQLDIASALIFCGVILDFFDGFFARILKVQDDFGVQLDSMADLITSGLAPSFILFKLFCLKTTFNNLSIFSIEFPFPLIALTALIVPIFAAIRLSSFNIDQNQKNQFIGLPTPMTAIFIASLPFINFEYNFYYLCITAILLSLLMVSKIKLFSIKINPDGDMQTKLNIFRIIMLVSSLILLFIYSLAAIPFIVVLYIILSIINNLI